MYKEEWGSGPWEQEPDKEQWRDPATGLPCLAARNLVMGHWCGYVGVPPGHRYHGVDYGAVEVDVHGGLTYAAPCSDRICHTPEPGEPDDVWWFGFDCAHGGDLVPQMEWLHRLLSMPRILGLPEDTYKDLAYVRAECERLAAQLRPNDGRALAREIDLSDLQLDLSDGRHVARDLDLP